ncbi:MAG: hypothetical protein M0P91_02815 [Sulfuricurvum sp.]|jgi:phosphate/sulfate permease|uniref:hypothetical protein n=1 Tax=Sulfuricurvum sp. TaxID=2025608 RepID=UPI0025E6F618|nr:hypothetical protein [Sulfuricurvum sp.]MCK9372104.1 hypothetical protein [Sulfuricurvum sp.]
MEIREEILKSINNTEVLKLEHQHVNTLIQQNEADFTKTIQWFMGISMASIGAILSSISGFSMNLIEEGKKYSVDGIKTAVPFILDSLLYAGFISIALFAFILFFTIRQRKQLIAYKEKIIQKQFSKYSRIKQIGENK